MQRSTITLDQLEDTVEPEYEVMLRTPRAAGEEMRVAIAWGFAFEAPGTCLEVLVDAMDQAIKDSKE